MSSERTANNQNKLANTSSPYLLQHADNPVNWYPWGQEALEKAEKENKPILLSIGYSSCHWCHVMAHESFENEEIAAIMNENFINIKLDREERPDIDNIYMDAVQVMGLRGGWPLNVFLTPDQKPFYGGTYFPPDQWKRLLTSVADAYTNKYEQLAQSADQFAENLNQSEAQKYGLMYAEEQLTMHDFDSAYQSLAKKFDPKWGGFQRAPKFPMPVVWNYLLTYADLSGSKEAIDHLTFTLDKMAYGGIYDHLGGGFARYSVDGQWHVPHFEKMLYDNGQLLSLYADAYKLTKKPQYLEVISGITDWLEREMTDTSGGFYSALDADSEGEEGRFYVWTFEEFKDIAGKDFSLLAEYYDVSKKGNWEDEKNVLRMLESKEVFADDMEMPVEEIEKILEAFKTNAMKVRSQRIRPGLDSKILTGWNALMLSGLCKAYQATGSSTAKKLARENARFITEQLTKDGHLIRVKGENIPAYLEDYAAVIQAFILYYETFFDEAYLRQARILANRSLERFFDPDEQLFYYTSNQSEQLIARKKEIFDNVIPASNSIMAENLYKLGLMYDDVDYKSTALQMVLMVNKLIKQEPEYLANWASTSLKMIRPTAEILCVGDDYKQQMQAMNRHYFSNVILMANAGTSQLPLFEYKEPLNGRTTFFVCYDKVCEKPVHDISIAIEKVHEVK
ncbi:thioredoxin domain-containing protein [Marinoscillum sp.]|uniref:thioredoxin domain-containing protein n=1 Tax=Marinoscillum sp. TaxID=2024838 RepID=UPI003BA894EC